MKNNNQYDVYTFRTFRYNYINYSYLVVDKQTLFAFLVDPSWDIDPFVSLIKLLKCKLQMVLITHSHYDHINLIDQLIRLYDIPIYMSRIESEYYNFSCRNLCKIEDKELIKIGNLFINCIHTPGHTQGSMCFYIFGSLFTGDTLFAEGCGLCNFEGGSASQMYESLKKIKQMIPESTLIYPGHSFGISVGQPFQRILSENIYYLIKDKAQFVNFRMRKNQKSNLDFK